MNLYRKPRVRIVGLTAVLLRGFFGAHFDFNSAYGLT